MTAAEYSTAVGAFGLATGFWDTGSVGIGGITLAGGIGYLTRKYGMTIDSVLGAEIVTADGEILHADNESHPELFWAIRGGGGNFGVVTRFRYRLHPVRQILGGLLMVPATADALVRLMEAADAAATGILGAASVVGAFLTGWPSIIAVILNYVKRSEVRGTWLESHFRWQIRTFWFGLLWVSLCVLFVIFTLGIGILIVWLPIAVVTIWFIYRVARGWAALNSNQPMRI